MKLQLALDHTSLEAALPVAVAVARYVDIIELGTPLIKTAGLYGLRVIRSLFPTHLIVADLKTMDAGEYESSPFYEAGADICTVLGAADDETIKGVIKAANKYGKRAQVDLINVFGKSTKAAQVNLFGAHIVGIHTGIDQQSQGQTPLADLSNIIHVLDPEHISVAGGINLDTLASIVELKPGIVVVGGAITSAEEPADIARKMSRVIDNVL